MIDFNKITEVNKTLKTTPIKGKEYAEVNQRVKAFRMLCPEGSISTEIVSLADGVCVVRATITNADGFVLATGTAYEKEGSSNINRTSYIENCETSAIGRALGFCGIGIDTSIASYEEVATAIMQQEEKPSEIHIKCLTDLAKEKGVTIERLCEKYRIKAITDISMADYTTCVNGLRKMESVNGN